MPSVLGLLEARENKVREEVARLREGGPVLARQRLNDNGPRHEGAGRQFASLRSRFSKSPDSPVSCRAPQIVRRPTGLPY
jgi:hypothetical protein